MEVEGRRRRGRPRRRLLDCLKEDLEEKQLRVQDAADWQRWRAMTVNGDPA